MGPTPCDDRHLALQNAYARRNAILAELATTQWGPNVSEQGRSVDRVGYKASLYQELEALEKYINYLAWAGGETVVSVVR